MRLALRAGAAAVALAALYAAFRLFVHSGTLLTPALVTPSMDAHRAVSPSLDARVGRLVQESRGGDRSRRPKLIALTFDDGPYPVDTALLLERLRALHLPATFFLIGRDAEQYPELTRRIAAQGHEIANHTLTHPDLDRLSDAGVRAELDGGRAALERYVRDPAIATYFRPPHGRYTEATLRVAQAAGYSIVLWNDDPGDWRTVTAQQVSNHIERHASAPDIVLLHSGKVTTIQMLDTIAADFRAQGYTFVTVGQLLRQAGPDDINHPARNIHISHTTPAPS